MELCTISNLVALAEEISGLSSENVNTDANLTKQKFDKLIDDIFKKIDCFTKWDRGNRIVVRTALANNTKKSKLGWAIKYI